MKTIKKVTALLISMVLLFSFVTAHVFAVVNAPGDTPYWTELDRLTQHFKSYGVEIPSYAQVYVSEYCVNDCDMGAKTWVDNPNKGTIDDILFTQAAYVKLEAEFESGLSGTLEDYANYAQGADYAYAILFAPDVADVEDDDYLVDFYTTHNVLFGYRRYHPSNTDFYDQADGTDTIRIFKAD